MGLQVWLPFNKDNRNVGLANINVTKNGITQFVSEGYTSDKCVKFGTEIGFYETDTKFTKHVTEMSVSFFVNFTSFFIDNATVFGFFWNDSAKWEDYIFGFLRNRDGDNFCFCVSDTLSSTEDRCSTNKLSLDTWYHFVLTYKNGVMKIYQDGVLTSTYTTKIEPAFSLIDRLFIGNAPDIFYHQTDIKMNDFRVYDHCITEEDVKRIYNCKIMDIVATSRGHGFFYDNSGLLINEFDSTAITYSGNSMHFDGGQSLIKAPSGLSINSGTLSIWFYPSQKSSLGEDSQVIYLDGTSKMSIVLYNGRTSIITCCNGQYSGKYLARNVVYNSWNHIVAVYSPKGGVSCFVLNGVTLQAKEEDSWPEQSEELFIGGSESYSASFNGYISKITVYRNQLTEDEAKQLYAIEQQVNILPKI